MTDRVIISFGIIFLFTGPNLGIVQFFEENILCKTIAFAEICIPNKKNFDFIAPSINVISVSTLLF